MSSLIIGVDGGGSKTTAILAMGDGTILGRGQAGPSNYHAIGVGEALEALDRAIACAFDNAGLAAEPIDALALGLAGMGRPADRTIFEAWAKRSHPQARLKLVNDAEILLAAGTPDGRGIAIIAGTGSLIFGQTSDGRTARAGGWGYRMGDEGSGYAAGLAALQAVARAWDGRGGQTNLTERLLDHFGVAVAPDLIAEVYRDTIGRPEIAALARYVDLAAEDGDAVAGAILQSSAEELALGAKAVMTQLGLKGDIPAALGGGYVTGSRLLQQFVQESAVQQGVHLRPVTPVMEPALGAVKLASALYNL